METNGNKYPAIKAGNFSLLKVAATFLVSLPAMWLIGQIAIFFFGFGIWLIPWGLGGLTGTFLFPQNGSALFATEFDGPIFVFAILAAIQNAFIVWLYLKRKPSSRIIKIAFWALASATLAGALIILLLLVPREL